MESCTSTSCNPNSPHICHFEQTLLLLSNFSSCLSISLQATEALFESRDHYLRLHQKQPLFKSLKLSSCLANSLQITEPLFRSQSLSLTHTTTIRGYLNATFHQVTEPLLASSMVENRIVKVCEMKSRNRNHQEQITYF